MNKELISEERVRNCVSTPRKSLRRALLCGLLVVVAGHVRGDALQIEVELQQFPAITVASEDGSNIVVEVSHDLSKWTPLVNIYTTKALGFYRDLDAAGEKRRYYRARMPGISREEMQSVWESSGIDAYQFDFGRICFCPPHFTLSGTVNVVNGNVQEITNVKGQGGLPVESPDLSEFMTIDDLFAIIEREIGSADEVSVKYDAENGYPARVLIDPILGVADDEIKYEVSQFVGNAEM